MSSPSPCRTEILSIGDELMFGHIVDTNCAWLAAHLLGLGMPASHFQTVGDELEDIVAAFRLALSRADVVIATGGLGPTGDDLTMEGLARAVDRPLTHREEVLDQMSARLKRPKDRFTTANRKQAQLPEGAMVLRNDWGTAPGVRLPLKEDREVYLMPGVPREMKGIFSTWIEPALRQRSTNTVLYRYYHSFALPESIVGDRLKDLMEAGLNPDLGTKVGGGIVSVRAVGRGADRAQAETALNGVDGRVREALGEFFFGTDETTLAAATFQVLRERNLKVALAESCTAGLVASLLGAVPGVSACLIEGAVTYANEAKMRVCGVREETLKAHGAVSHEAAREMAAGIRERSGADIAVSVTGIAGPDGGTPEKPVGLVCFGIATPRETRSDERRFLGFDRAAVRDRSAHTALDLLRRAALAWTP
jgi:nicotinamide-nucleotide amidase